MPILGITALISALLLVIIISNGGALSRGPDRPLGGSVAFLIVGGGGFVFLWLWLANARLLVGNQTVGFQDFLGRRRVWRAEQVARVIDVAVIYTKQQRPQRGIYLIGSDGRRLLALNPRAWDADSLSRLVSATGRLLEFRDDPMNAWDFRREFPGAMSWAGTHVIGMTMVIMAAGVLVAIGLVFAASWLSHR